MNADMDYMGLYSSLEMGLLTDDEIEDLVSNHVLLGHCTRCGKMKFLSDFDRSTTSARGIQNWCKECSLQRDREDWRKKSRKLYISRRRTRKANMSATLTILEWEHILDYYNHCCAYCGRSEQIAGKLTQDHVYPVSRGGGYTVINIVPACRVCNSQKNARTPEEAGMSLTRMPLVQTNMEL